MDNSYKLIKVGRKDDLWQKHCGYLDLSRSEFRNIQERLMLEQLQLLKTSAFGRKLLAGHMPSSVDEFRQVVPLTTYADYADLLMERNEEGLPGKPYVWARSSGRSSGMKPKWIPYTKTMYDHLSDAVVGAMLMSSCSQPGVVNLERNDKFLMATAPPPYASGYISRATRDNLETIFLPPLEEGEKMSYGERVAAGFKLALREGLDYFMGISIVLARMGEQFEQQSAASQPSKELLNLPSLWRLMKALIISKIRNRPILPKDVWKLKGIMSGGTDTEIYKDKIEYYWGKKPLEGFACTEAGNMAMQSWNYKGMTFFPDNVFLEFIPVEGDNRQTTTLLYDELEVGIYELVFSSFHGGVLVRYRIGDLFEVLSIGDNEIGTKLPQLKFYSRIDDLIDLGGFVRFTERDIWKTIDATGIEYQDWVVRKEINNSTTMLHIYIELKPGHGLSEKNIRSVLDQQFTTRFSEFKDLKEMLQINPLMVTILQAGSFEAYMKMKAAAGADMAHLKPPHMQPSQEIMAELLSIHNR